MFCILSVFLFQRIAGLDANKPCVWNPTTAAMADYAASFQYQQVTKLHGIIIYVVITPGH